MHTVGTRCGLETVALVRPFVHVLVRHHHVAVVVESATCRTKAKNEEAVVVEGVVTEAGVERSVEEWAVSTKTEKTIVVPPLPCTHCANTVAASDSDSASATPSPSA